ncbi:MAG: type I 3-dehydroquinate dehydratase [Candidatus Omnitrophica bacterium]|nr:type I 3-dehydroquinate dehydratase [Candidatus Omnitrophota bacterium]
MSKIDSCIALVITDQETNAQIKNLGVGLLELRADLFKKLDPAYTVDQINRRKSLKIPLLLTLRNQKDEGAQKIFSDEKKWRIITDALPLVDMVDIELSSPLLKKVVAKACQLGVKVIVSSHYLQGMPRDLESILKKSLSAGADIVKIAAKACSFDDVMTMLAFTQRHRKHNLITISLGPLGAISRLILPAAGSQYTYTFLNKATASGQVGILALKSHMKVYYPA